ncbi:hypothetical protein GQ43DRAFT_419774 [Delitschia confertaspora ATCC 74209]|uniref:XRRM domain-containing protein n=1 Tax=Delitschia confertaspora ATCC 74209 TaxID=1513339 RepID=A0A9P4JNE8_9PLEO|nr:hypothetical protein GQ43DRAFT_419774 [Delitschia confertaspora ATCC 74209]
MFVPRVLLNRGFKQQQKKKRPPSDDAPSEVPPAKKAHTENVQPSASTEVHTPNASKGTAAATPAQHSEIGPAAQPHDAIKPRGSRFTVPEITDEYLEKIVCGLELIFSDYALQDELHYSWLESHHRTVDREDKYIHLSVLLDNPSIATLKPRPTQPLLARALATFPSPILQTPTTTPGSHVRRNPKTFLPSSALSASIDNTFWDQRTIYVEPHHRQLANIPAAISYHLKKHGGMRQKWLPIQAVQKIGNGPGMCAFVVLSGVVEHADIWRKWREGGKPENWIVLTKMEHRRREREYLDLLKQEKKERLKVKSIIERGQRGVPHREKKGKEKTAGYRRTGEIEEAAKAVEKNTKETTTAVQLLKMAGGEKTTTAELKENTAPAELEKKTTTVKPEKTANQEGGQMRKPKRKRQPKKKSKNAATATNREAFSDGDAKT